MQKKSRKSCLDSAWNSKCLTFLIKNVDIEHFSIKCIQQRRMTITDFKVMLAYFVSLVKNVGRPRWLGCWSLRSTWVRPRHSGPGFESQVWPFAACHPPSLFPFPVISLGCLVKTWKGQKKLSEMWSVAYFELPHSVTRSSFRFGTGLSRSLVVAAALVLSPRWSWLKPHTAKQEIGVSVCGSLEGEFVH